MATAQNYIIYRTVASGTQGVGYVVNTVLWDGTTTFAPGTGLALALDATRAWPIGSTYAPTATTAATTGAGASTSSTAATPAT